MYVYAKKKKLTSREPTFPFLSLPLYCIVSRSNPCRNYANPLQTLPVLQVISYTLSHRKHTPCTKGEHSSPRLTTKKKRQRTKNIRTRRRAQRYTHTHVSNLVHAAVIAPLLSRHGIDGRQHVKHAFVCAPAHRDDLRLLTHHCLRHIDPPISTCNFIPIC